MGRYERSNSNVELPEVVLYSEHCVENLMLREKKIHFKKNTPPSIPSGKTVVPMIQVLPTHNLYL